MAVYVVGSINVDVVAYVDRHPLIGETLFGNELRAFPGGKGLNQAIACRRLGAPVHMVGKIGADDFGKQMKDVLDGEGIGLANLGVCGEAPTGTALIWVNKSSENSIVVVSGANKKWELADLEAVPFAAGDLVVAQLEVPIEIVQAAFAKAKVVGARTLLNPAPVLPLSSELLGLTDLLVLNEIELAMLAGQEVDPAKIASVKAAAGKLLDQGAGTVVTTLGARGAVCIGADEAVVAGQKVEAVDTTGAGDCFIGALAARLAAGEAMQNALLFANKAAAISVTRLGASSSMPHFTEVAA